MLIIIVIVVILFVIFGSSQIKAAKETEVKTEVTINEAKNRYFTAKDRLDGQKLITHNAAKLVGRKSMDVWSNELSQFLELITPLTKNSLKLISGKNKDKSPIPTETRLSIINDKIISKNAFQKKEAMAVGVGTGVLTCAALYGSAAAFGSASTGAAIAGLTGAAQANATLAFLGGGSLSSGGLGILAGKAALGGVFLSATYAAYGAYSNLQAMNNLEEAKKLSSEVTEEVRKMAKLEMFLKELESTLFLYGDTLDQMTLLYRDVLEDFEIDMKKQMIKQEKFLMNRIRLLFKKDIKVDYRKISEVDLIKLDSGYSLTMILEDFLNTPILTLDGQINPDLSSVIHSANNAMNEYFISKRGLNGATLTSTETTDALV